MFGILWSFSGKVWKRETSDFELNKFHPFTLPGNLPDPSGSRVERMEATMPSRMMLRLNYIRPRGTVIVHSNPFSLCQNQAKISFGHED